jgi:hypothetical protein
MHQQLWGYKVEWKSVSRGTGGKKVEYHWDRRLGEPGCGGKEIKKSHHCTCWELNPGLPACSLVSTLTELQPLQK